MKKQILFILLTISLLGCDHPPRKIVCYSNGKEILNDTSAGGVYRQDDSWQYQSRTSGKYTRVSGDCIVEFSK